MGDFVKLSSLVDGEFTVQRVDGYKWKMWDQANKQMLVSDDFVKGYRKVYTVETDKGTLDLGSGQLSSLLEAVFFNGRADIIGVTYKVKSNGKSGLDIRYYFNAQRQEKPAPSGYEAARQKAEELRPSQEGSADDLNNLFD